MSDFDIDNATLLAFKAHKGQVDKAGCPYFSHLLRVERKLNQCVNHTDYETIAIMLHDIVEDTSYTIEKLRSIGVPEKSLDIIELLTKDKSLTYTENIMVIINSGNQEAMRAKLCDNLDNMDPSRVKMLTEVGHLVKRYKKSAKLLIKHLRPEYLEGLQLPEDLLNE